MKIKDLIAYLKTQDPELDVGYGLHSEFKLLELPEISVRRECVPRPDGWIQRARPGHFQQLYLMFPGN